MKHPYRGPLQNLLDGTQTNYMSTFYQETKLCKGSLISSTCSMNKLTRTLKIMQLDSRIKSIKEK